jgi:hypothetical protein
VGCGRCADGYGLVVGDVAAAVFVGDAEAAAVVVVEPQAARAESDSISARAIITDVIFFMMFLLNKLFFKFCSGPGLRVCPHIRPNL